MPFSAFSIAPKSKPSAAGGGGGGGESGAGVGVAEPAGLWIAKDGNDASLIVRVAAEAGERWIRFARM